MRIIGIIISIFWFSSFGFSQKVIGTVDSTNVLLGNKVGYFIKVLGENLTDPQLDITSLDTIDSFTIIPSNAWKALENNKGFIQEMKIIPTQEGFISIPKVKINFKKNGKKIAGYTHRINLDVKANKTLPQDILANKPIAIEPMTMEDYLPYLIGFGALFILFALGYYFYKKKNKKEDVVIPEIIIPAHEIALSELSKLKASKIWESNPKAFHSKLSMILRTYLGGRFSIHAVESTTGEIVDDMKKANMNKEYIQKFKEIFEMADLVKFAKATPPKDIHNTILNFAEKFVVSTKPKLESNETEK